MPIRSYREEVYPSSELEICQENLDMFFRFMYARHMIWHNRFILNLPKEQWTDDEILKKTKYTNIYRELDRGTLWYLDGIAQCFIDNAFDFKSLVWFTVLYRLCNRTETMEEVGLPIHVGYDSDNLHNVYWKKLDDIFERGESVMTSAHLTCPTPGGFTKVEGYMMAVNDLHKKLDTLVKEIKEAKTLKDVFDSLRMVHCVGVFTAYEVCCDLMYTGSIGKTFFEDGDAFQPFKEDDWANAGPGAKEGIRMLYPSTTKTENINNRMKQLRDEQHQHFERLGIKFPFYERFTKGHLSLRSIEHSLCEFQKYWLQKKNLGKQRMIFSGKDKNRIVEKGEFGKKVRYKIIVDPDCGDKIKKIYVE